ncbi:MAG: hypothetical protein AMXMBFR13_40240 [Phycisphaerae bacterium]
MSFVLLYGRFPELAKRETRSVIVPPDTEGPLPPDEYGFLEMFCDEPGCDCRRVFLMVVGRNDPQCHAVIAYGWESPEFYMKWMHKANPEMAARLKGPILNPGSPETVLAPVLLHYAEHVLLRDSAYVERVKRHYELFRAQIDAGPRPHLKGGRTGKRKKRK